MSDLLTAEELQQWLDWWPQEPGTAAEQRLIRALVLLARDHNRAMLALGWEIEICEQHIEWAAVKLPEDDDADRTNG